MPAFDERFENKQSDQLIYSEHLVRYQLAAQMAAGKSVLDIACGSGYGSAILASVASEVIGADIDAETVKADQAYYKQANLRFTLADAENLPAEWNGKFDLIVSFETIEHLANCEEYFKNLKQSLKPGGILLVSTPNIKVFGQTNPFHLHEYAPEELEKALKGRFNQVVMLKQRNALASYIEIEGQEPKMISVEAKGEAEYLVALASEQEISLKDAYSNIALNQPAWQNILSNPSTKIVNSVYKAVSKVPGMARLLTKLRK
jgi:2-polyprenyl-3-methyl-5-hydroxy-6-metoxy-1,4-benzoquinol methylase